VHLCARLGHLTPPAGAPTPFRPGVPFPSDGPDGLSSWDGEMAIAALYAHLNPATARALARRLRPLAPAAGGPPRDDGHGGRSALVYTAEDEIFDPAWERYMAREVLRTEPIELAGGHFPMLERPDELVSVLERLVPR
jgi:Alpha/beta hydrolase family